MVLRFDHLKSLKTVNFPKEIETILFSTIKSVNPYRLNCIIFLTINIH